MDTGISLSASETLPGQPGTIGSNELDRAIDSALTEKRIVGTVILVARNGNLVYQRAAGLADREAGRAMTLDTPFRFASLSKPFTTMAALQLITRGTLSPDDLLTKWLPDFTPLGPDGTPARIKVGDLLAHIDYGFQQPAGGTYRGAGISDGLDESRVTLAENLRRLASVPLDRVPGVTWRYSVATDVLGAVVAAAAGVSLDTAIDQLVIRPLRLGAAFVWTDDALAVPYRDGDAAPVRLNGITEVPLPGTESPGVRFDPERIRRHNAFPSGGAGMAGRASDMLRLLESYRAGNFLSASLRDAARTARVGAEAQTLGSGWGYGWMGSVLVDPRAASSPLSAGSVSWGGVYGHMWAIDFERRTTVVAMTNTAFEGMFGKFAKDVISAVAQAMPIAADP